MTKSSVQERKLPETITDITDNRNTIKQKRTKQMTKKSDLLQKTPQQTFNK